MQGLYLKWFMRWCLSNHRLQIKTNLNVALPLDYIKLLVKPSEGDAYHIWTDYEP